MALSDTHDFLIVKEKGIAGMELNNLKVTCYSDHPYAERPQSFLWQGIEYKVKEIEKA